MKAIYIANKNKKEFHSIKRAKPECNVDKITDEHKVLFQTGRKARAAGFDACAHCNRYWKSKH